MTTKTTGITFQFRNDPSAASVSTRPISQRREQDLEAKTQKARRNTTHRHSPFGKVASAGKTPTELRSAIIPNPYSHSVRTTDGVEPRRYQVRGKVSGCQDSARDTMVFIAGAAITHQCGNAVGSNAELGSFLRQVAGITEDQKPELVRRGT